MTMQSAGDQAVIEKPSQATENTWTLVSQLTGGTVTALAVSPTFTDDQLVFAGTSVGLYKSTDGGVIWQPVEGLGSPFIQTIVFSPTYAKDGHIFAGTLSSGIYRSPDRGESWLQLPFGYSGGTVTSMVLSPTFADDGVIIAGTSYEGIFRSINRGATWSQQNFGLMSLDVQALAISPNYQTDETLFAVTMDGLFRSTNGARAWRQVERGLDSLAPQSIALSPKYATDRTLWVTTEDFGIYRSTDGGTTWKESSEGLPSNAINVIVVTGDNALLCGTAEGAICRSTSGGTSWDVLYEGTNSPLSLAMGPEGLVLAGLHQSGILRSTDNGQTWQEANTDLAARPLLGLSFSPQFEVDQTIFACGLQDGVLRSTDGGVNWENSNEGLPAPAAAAAIAVSPLYGSNKTVYVAAPRSVYRSADAGASWNECPVEIGENDLRSIAVAPPARQGERETVAALSPDGVWISRDGGHSWTKVSESFGGEELMTVAFSPNYLRDNTLFVTSRLVPITNMPNMVSIWRSSDGGRSWVTGLRQKTNSGWIAFAVPSTYRYEPGYLGDVFAASGDFFFRTMLPNKRMWVSEHIGGATTAVVSLATSPDFGSDKLVAAGTTDGPMLSRDAGLTWTTINDKIGEWPVPVIEFSPGFAKDRRIYALTAGSRLWRYEDNPAGR